MLVVSTILADLLIKEKYEKGMDTVKKSTHNRWQIPATRQQAAQATYKLSSTCSTTATKKAYRNENIQLFLNDMTEEKNPWQLHAPEACNL